MLPVRRSTRLNIKRPTLPRIFPPLTETPWLIAFAGEHGIGVSPGRPAFDLVLKALREGREEQQLAALDYLRQYGNEAAADVIHQIYQEYPGELRESAFQHSLAAFSRRHLHKLFELDACEYPRFSGIAKTVSAINEDI